ncbi:tumor necrosis factor ligand superfamily member 15 isoform X2 [Electrophorus electricus]|uniref:tumor necrosis factor ligand superfamily member 15 isoform X2 n=1 Tax=Electrophorus electricus TaxID=8005 RepID=UPI0015CFB5BC|nr:tumor necrosis factor ligand superfamily member 15 isoform X2 [Electrophorus electricus]
MSDHQKVRETPLDISATYHSLLERARWTFVWKKDLPSVRIKNESEEHGAKANGSETSQFRALADGGSKEPYQAFLKIACKHPPSAHDTLLMWEQNKLFGFRLSSDSATLIVPSAGMYRIALQVTYRGTDQVSSSKQMILEHHLAVLSDSYQQDRTMLSAFETVYSENTNWRKSLYSEGIFNFQKGDGLKVKTSNLRLVDCDGNVGTKTFLTAYPLAVA